MNANTAHTMADTMTALDRAMAPTPAHRNVGAMMTALDRAMAPLARTGRDVHTARIVDTMTALDRAMAPAPRKLTPAQAHQVLLTVTGAR